MKRTLCLLFTAAMLLTMTVPLGVSATITADSTYLYENFESTVFNGSNPEDWSGLQYGSSIYARGGVGHTDNNGALSMVNTATDSSKVTTENAGSKDNISWEEYTYAKHETLTSNKDKYTAIPADFDGNALLLSYDVYVPSDGLYSMQVDVYEQGISKQARFIMGPRITNYPKENEYVSSGVRKQGIVAIGRQNGETNAGATSSWGMGTRTTVLGEVGGTWVNVSTIVTYDKTKDMYCAKSYANGKLITDGWGSAVCYFKTTAEGYLKNTTGEEHNSFFLKIVGNSNTSNERIRIDNIILREYGYATLNENQQISVGQTEVTVPFVNAALKDNAAAPAAVKNASASYGSDFSASDITALKYAADDIFMAHGESAAVSVSEKTSDGIKLNIPALAEGEKLKLKIQNCGDFSGAALANNTTVLYNDTVSDGFLGIELADFDDELKALGADNVIPAAIKTMKLLKKDTDKTLTLTKKDSEESYTASAANGAYTFDFSTNTLAPDSEYELKSDGSVIATFKTDSGALDLGTATNAGGKASVEVRNITGGSQTVYLVYAIYAEDGTLIALDYKNETVAAGEIKTVSTENALTDSEAKTARAFVWDGFVNVKPLGESTPFTLE